MRLYTASRYAASQQSAEYGLLLGETTYTYTPSDARAARALCFDDVRAERAPRVRGVHEGLGGMLGVHVAHFRPMCLTARNSLRHPTSPITSRTGPTRFDARSSWGGWPEWTLGEHPQVLGARVACRKGVNLMPFMPHPHAPAHSRVRGKKRVVRAPGCTPHRATRGVAGFARFAH